MSLLSRRPAPSLEWLQETVKWIEERQESNLTTYVHCRNGVSRSGMVVVAYIMYKKYWTRGEAPEFVRSKRPVTRPNPAFMQRLEEWEEALRRK